MCKSKSYKPYHVTQKSFKKYNERILQIVKSNTVTLAKVIPTHA